MVGAYCGEGGFIGIREKFGFRYLSTEYLPGMGGGGVMVIEQIGTVPEGVELREYYEVSLCSKHSRPTRFDRIDGLYGEWCHADDGSVMEKGDWSEARGYDPLFKVLDEPTKLELAAEQERRRELPNFKS